MMLKTSSRKINPFWNMIGFTTRKNIGIIIVLCIASLIYYPGSFIVEYENILVSTENNVNNYLIENFGVAVTVFSAIIAVLFNMLNFNFLYKKSSSDVFHAFPLTRSELLISRLFSGLVATFIPTLLCYLSFGILLALNSWMGTFYALFCYFIHTILTVLVCSSFSMIFVICAGSSFDLSISLVGGNLALLAVGWIFESILDETLIGFNGYHTSDVIYNLSPPYFCGVGVSNIDKIIELGYIKSSFIEFLIRSIIYIVSFTVISLLLYNRRKAEKGETAYAYKFMYLICSLLAGICGGYILGMIFTGNITDVGFWFFAVVGCLLTSVIYGTVTNRGFKGVWQSVLMGVLSAIVLISVAVIGITGGFGYTTRIPDEDKIKTASVYVFNEEIPFENPQQILDLHKAIINKNATDYETAYNEYNSLSSYNESIKYDQSENVKFYYELENGKMMSRNFTVYSPIIAKELLKIYQSDERLAMIKNRIDVTNPQDINLYFYVNNDYHNVNITESELKEFLQSYWLDVQNSDESIFSDENYQYLEITGDKKLDNNRFEWFGFQFEWHDSFSNTQAFIQNNNLVERSKQQQSETNQKY